METDLQRRLTGAWRKRLFFWGALGICLAAGGGFGWLWWRDARVAAIVRAAVPEIPDLGRWPREYASRARAATAIARGNGPAVEALTELAGLYHANDCYQEAEQVERGLHELEPRNARWTYLLADDRAKLGDVDGQRQFLETTLKLAPYYAAARLKLADLLLKLGLPEEARPHYDRRLALVPNDPYARLGLARIALQRGDRRTARRYLEAIARANPDFPTAHNLLSQIYTEAGDAAGAAEQRRLSGATGEWREAEDRWLAWMYAWSYDPYRLETLGGGQLRPRQLEIARRFYRDAVGHAPADGLAYEALAEVYVQLNRPEDAVKVAEEGLAAAPRTAELYATLAAILRRQGNVIKAITVLRRGVAVLWRDPQLRCLLGDVLQGQGRGLEAAGSYRRAVRLDPDYQEGRWKLGTCLLGLGLYQEAQANLERALELRPKDSAALVALTQELLNAGRLDQADCCIHVLVRSGAGEAVQRLMEQGLAAARQAGDSNAANDFADLLAHKSR